MAKIDEAMLAELRANPGRVWTDDENGSTLTVFVGIKAEGHSIKVEDEGGIVWYGLVDADGFALVTRTDLMPQD